MSEYLQGLHWNLILWSFSSYDRHWVCEHFMKTLMSMSTNVHRPYVYDHVGLYISLVSNFIDLIISYWSTILIIYINA